MPVRLDKPWSTAQQAQQLLHGNLGVFQLADEQGDVIFIGYAGGKSQFGLKAEVDQAMREVDGACQVRWEVTSAYLSRFRELMMVHKADHGKLPKENEPITLGKLSPA